eukprot:TRINITY_DN31976_c0_g1_i1.p1 TRINITY_DN31976_c0_g1~~TRINITY_DN31976_c0_g1_i1.p1  ORF type:complete len:422 (+),score=99.17 TRINITY_DN31976_c0_g1_i1:79-1266(+)
MSDRVQRESAMSDPVQKATAPASPAGTVPLLQMGGMRVPSGRAVKSNNNNTFSSVSKRAAALLRRARAREARPHVEHQRLRPAAAVARAWDAARARLATAWRSRPAGARSPSTASSPSSPSSPTCAAAARRAFQRLVNCMSRKGRKDGEDLREEEWDFKWGEECREGGIQWEAPRFVQEFRLLPPGEGPNFVSASCTTVSSSYTSASSSVSTSGPDAGRGRVRTVRPGVHVWVEAAAGAPSFSPIPECVITPCYENPDHLPDEEKMLFDDGWPYTLDEFISFYGGRAEWDAAMRRALDCFRVDAVCRRVAQYVPYEWGQLHCMAPTAYQIVAQWHCIWAEGLAFVFAMQTQKLDELVAELPVPTLAISDLNMFGRELRHSIRRGGRTASCRWSCS